MTPGVSAGHDGILVVTDRRVLFLALRRTVSHPYSEIVSVAAKGRWLGGRLSLTTTEANVVIGQIAPRRAAQLAAAISARAVSRPAPPR